MPNPGLEANLRAGSSTCRKTRSKKRFWFPIHLAALGGSVEMVELLVETAPSAMTAPSFRLCGLRARGSAKVAARRAGRLL